MAADVRHQPAVAAGEPLAAGIAAEVLAGGGNAVDAGVAATIALCVTKSEQVQLGGVAPMMIRPSGSAQVFTLEGVGRWPARADRTHFVTEHDGLIPHGVLRCVTPAAPHAWITALKRFGTMGFAEVAERACHLARQGFPAGQDLADASRVLARGYRNHPGNLAIWRPDNTPISVGDTFKQPDLAATLDQLIDADRRARTKEGRIAGLDAVLLSFYARDIAAAIEKHFTNEGGWLTINDLRNHTTPVTESLRCQTMGGTLHCCGGWAQSATLGQSLVIAEHAGAAHALPGSANLSHILLESIKLACIDRDAFLGDPEFVDFSADRLFASDVCKKRAELISHERAREGPTGTDVEEARRVAEDGSIASVRSGEVKLDTSAVAVVDGNGNIFACTPSDQSSDAPVVPGLGFVVSTRGAQSHVASGHPAVLVPMKRPRSSAFPFLFETADGRVICGGGPGADLQLQALVQVLSKNVLHGIPLREAIFAPRCFTLTPPTSGSPYTSSPGKVTVEQETDRQVIADLERRGHLPYRSRSAGLTRPSVHVLELCSKTGRSVAHSDPRREGGSIVLQREGRS